MERVHPWAWLAPGPDLSADVAASAPTEPWLPATSARSPATHSSAPDLAEAGTRGQVLELPRVGLQEPLSLRFLICEMGV